MTLIEFIENLKGLNNGGNFSDILLESLYRAIKNEPLECANLDNEDMMPFDEHGLGSMGGGGSVNGTFSLRPVGSNPFLQMPDPQTAKEYKYGWLLRKCCMESDGKKATFLKRGWKMFYASLRDMVLYLHKDDKVFKNNTFDNITNAIRIHHAFATVASDYKKKQFVFRLRTADWAEYLFQTSNSTELFDWVSHINLVAAMFSSPPLPSGVGSSRTFQRPLLPVSKTRYTLQEQLEYHKKHVKQLQSELTRLDAQAVGAAANQFLNNSNTSHHFTAANHNKEFDKEKYSYLQYEIQRYTVYLNLLEEKFVSEMSQSNNMNSFAQQQSIKMPGGGSVSTPVALSPSSPSSPLPQINLANTSNNNNNNNINANHLIIGDTTSISNYNNTSGSQQQFAPVVMSTNNNNHNQMNSPVYFTNISDPSSQTIMLTPNADMANYPNILVANTNGSSALTTTASIGSQSFASRGSLPSTPIHHQHTLSPYHRSSGKNLSYTANNQANSGLHVNFNMSNTNFHANGNDNVNEIEFVNEGSNNSMLNHQQYHQQFQHLASSPTNTINSITTNTSGGVGGLMAGSALMTNAALASSPTHAKKFINTYLD